MKKNTKVQQRLLSETNLTYAKTVKLASAMELAQQGVDCVSGTVTKLKPDILKFSTTKQHNKSNQHHFILFYFILFYFILCYFILFYFIHVCTAI